MSEEYFDDKIRRKLNQIQPPYSSQAWERFQALLPVPWYIAAWKTIGIAHIALLLSLGALVFSWWQGQQLTQENQELRQKIQQGITRIDTIYQVQRDTVYLVQRVLTPVPAYVPNRPLSAVSRQESIVLNPVQSIGILEKGNETSPETPTSPVVEEIAKEEDKPAVTEPTDVSAPAVDSPFKKESRNWPVLHARVGLASDYVGLKFPTVGPQLEIFLTKNASIQGGILFSGQQTVVHARPSDFNLNTGVNFEDQYRDQIKNIVPRRIQNIAITSSFIQIPVLFKYYIPTPTAWSFQLMAGTKLDYRVFQEVSFLDGVLGDIQRRRFETLQKPKTFHSLTYGMGVQYQKGRLVGQLTPYFDFPFRSNLNGPTIPRRIGIQGVLLWDLYPQKRRKLEAWD